MNRITDFFKRDPERIQEPEQTQDPPFVSHEPVHEAEIDVDFSMTIERAIRKKIPPNINSMKLCLRQAGVTEYTFIEGGKKGPNTLIHIEGPGIRVPLEGHFLCFIARSGNDPNVQQPPPVYGDGRNE